MKRIRNSIASLAAIAVVLVTGTAFAQDNGDVPGLDRHDPANVQQVQLLLSGYHELPTREALAAVPGAHDIVLALAHTDGMMTRDRALAALGHYWPSGDVFLLYAKTVASPTTPDGTRHRIMVLAADAFGERAVPMLTPYLSNADVQLRITAVEALGRIRTDEVVALLEAHAAGESNPIVLERIERATRTLR